MGWKTTLRSLLEMNLSSAALEVVACGPFASADSSGRTNGLLEKTLLGPVLMLDPLRYASFAARRVTIDQRLNRS
jgi:hypothetical protein